MSKDINNYLHLYLGCDCMWAIIVPGQEPTFEKCHLKIRELHGVLNNLALSKPILRRLSSMTEEELKEWVGEPALSFTDHYCKKSIKKVCHSIYGLFNFISFYGNVNSIPWLLSKGFDLFGLIDEGLAIDATTIKTND